MDPAGDEQVWQLRPSPPVTGGSWPVRLRRTVILAGQGAGLLFLLGVWLAGELIAVLHLLGFTGGSATPWTHRLFALAWLLLWWPAGSTLVSALLGGLRWDTIRADETGVHCLHRFWGFRRRTLRLAWAQVWDITASHDGRAVLVGSGTGSHRLTELGPPQQRADLIADLARRVPASGVTARAAGLEAEWLPDRSSPAASGPAPALWLRRTWAEARASATRRALVAALLWAFTAGLALTGSWFAAVPGVGALVVSTSAINRVRSSPGWLLRDGRLLVGWIRPRDGSWIDPPRTVLALQLELHQDGEGVTTARLVAMLESGGRQDLCQAPAEAADLRHLGSWLAARADLPFTQLADGRPEPQVRPGERDRQE